MKKFKCEYYSNYNFINGRMEPLDKVGEEILESDYYINDCPYIDTHFNAPNICMMIPKEI